MILSFQEFRKRIDYLTNQGLDTKSRLYCEVNSRHFWTLAKELSNG